MIKKKILKIKNKQLKMIKMRVKAKSFQEMPQKRRNKNNPGSILSHGIRSGKNGTPPLSWSQFSSQAFAFSGAFTDRMLIPKSNRMKNQILRLKTERRSIMSAMTFKIINLLRHNRICKSILRKKMLTDIQGNRSSNQKCHLQ